MNERKRSTYLDLIKAFAIVLVVLGHCIQYGSGYEYFESEAFYGNVIFKGIYSFHMPLFALISGYLFFYTVSNKNFMSVVKKEISSIILPVFSWSVSYYLIFRGRTLLDVGLFAFLKNLLKFCLSDIWFLWAIFWCAIIINIVRYIFKDSMFAYIVILAILLVLPEKMNSHYYIYLYPYYVCGYLFNKHNLQAKTQKVLSKYYGIIIMSLLIIWCGLISRFNYDSYIYTSHLSLHGKVWSTQILVDFFRWAIGFVGSSIILVSGILAEKKFDACKNNMAVIKYGSYLGKHTLGVYVISFYLNNALYVVCGGASYNFFLILLETIVIMTIAIFFDWILMKNRILRKLYLGGR